MLNSLIHSPLPRRSIQTPLLKLGLVLPWKSWLFALKTHSDKKVHDLASLSPAELNCTVVEDAGTSLSISKCTHKQILVDLHRWQSDGFGFKDKRAAGFIKNELARKMNWGREQSRQCVHWGQMLVGAVMTRSGGTCFWVIHYILSVPSLLPSSLPS